MPEQGADYKIIAVVVIHNNVLPLPSFQQACEDDGSLPTRPEEPEESAAEKIYATLRECREQADPKRQKGVKMQGYLLKKKEKIGKWKQQFFLLKQDGTDSHLYFYDHPKVRLRLTSFDPFDRRAGGPV